MLNTIIDSAAKNLVFVRRLYKSMTGALSTAVLVVRIDDECGSVFLLSVIEDVGILSLSFRDLSVGLVMPLLLARISQESASAC